MADMRFTCPQCNQDITCDELWGGHQIQCPTCQAEIAVPQPQAKTQASPLVPKVPTGGTRLSAGRTQVARSEGALNAPVRQLVAKPKKKSPLPAIIGGIVVVAALGVGGYYGWGWLRERQEKLNAQRREVEKNSDGGELGHIANLNNVLDATEPGGRGLGNLKGGQGTGPKQRTAESPSAIPLPAGTPGAAPAGSPTGEQDLPLKPAIHTLELASAKIPEGRVNGMISGTNFVPESVRLDATPAAQVFRLTQGSLTSPDREILVYLHLRSGETVSGKSWNVSTDMKAPEAPQVAKRWKTNPRYAPTIKQYTTGYVMKLEFGELTNNAVSGKIYIAMPDTEQSVVAGLFKASFNTVTATATAGTPAPAAPAQVANPAVDRTMRDRYGVKR